MFVNTRYSSFVLYFIYNAFVYFPNSKLFHYNNLSFMGHPVYRIWNKAAKYLFFSVFIEIDKGLRVSFHIRKKSRLGAIEHCKAMDSMLQFSVCYFFCLYKLITISMKSPLDLLINVYLRSLI